MPDITQAILTQWCVVWKKTDTKTKHGQARVSSPVNVRCRWASMDQASVDQGSTTEHYPNQVPVGEYIPLGSYVWGPGKIVDLPSNPVYLEVVGSGKTPDINGNHPFYQISLQKASQTLPEVV
jgi:hypothetical protein